MDKINLRRAKGYINIARRANYIIWGVDNLNEYTKKMYLVVYRQDYGKTIEKLLQRISNPDVKLICLAVEDFNFFAGTDKSKIFAIKNKGISEQIINLLRGEDG